MTRWLKGKAKAILRKYVREHPRTIQEKTNIMMDHFGITPSVSSVEGQGHDRDFLRKLAVDYRLAVDRWIEENETTFKAMVAFTDTVEIDGKSYTETSMNGVSDTQTAEQFKNDENKILIVANKFQTGLPAVAPHDVR